MTETRDDEMDAPSDVPEPAVPEPAVPTSVVWSSYVLWLAMFALAVGVLFWPKPDPNQAPDGRLVDARGETVELDDRMAEVTLVHFWATWCPPCIAEVPSIRRLAASHADDDDFSFVMVAVADDVEKVAEFLGDEESLFDDDWDVAHDFGTTKLPETHLVVDGVIVERFVGATDWDSAAVRQRIQRALDSV